MIRRFIKYYRPHWRLLVLDLLCALSVAVIDLLFPMATSRILKEFIPNQQIRAMIIVGATLLVLYGVRFVLSYIIGYYGHVMGIKIETDMRSDLFRKLQILDYQYFDNKKTGELMTNLTTHLHDVSEMSHHAPEDIFISTLMLIGSFTILMFIEPILTLIVFVFLTMLVTYSISRRRKMINSFRVSRTVQGELNSEIESSISGIRLTKAYSNEQYEQSKFERVNSQYRSARSNIFREIGLYGSGNEFFANLAI